MTCGLRLQRPGFSKARRRILRPANVVIVSGVPGLSRWANLACARLTTFASTRNMSLAAGSVGKRGTFATRGKQAVNARSPSQSLSKSTLWPGDVSGDAHWCIGGQRRLHYFRSRLFAAWPASPRDAQRSRAEARKHHCAALPEAWTRTRCQRDDVTYALLHLYSQPMHKAVVGLPCWIARIGEPGIRRA